MSVSITIQGLDRLQRKLGTDFKPVLRGATKAIAGAIEGEIAPYPPTTAANRPRSNIATKRTLPWYERGYGTRWLRRDGSIGGRKTSQQLGRSWGIKSKGSIGAVLGSRATYSPYVHSHEKQAKFHGARGWVTDKEAVEKVVKRGDVQKILSQAVRKALG